MKWRAGILPLLLVSVQSINADAAIAPRYDGTIRVAALGPVKTLDPAQVSSAAENDLAVALFEGLVRQGPNGFEPAAATEWSHSPDERTWTFKLRPGMRFSDGAPVDAAAFIASWSRSPLQAGNQSASATAPDSLTLRIETPVHFPNMLATLSSIKAAVVRPVGEGSLVGSGPFRFAGTTKDGSYLLVARLDYHAGRPFAARVLVLPVAVAPERGQDFDVLDCGTGHRSTRPGLVGFDSVSGFRSGALRFDDAWFRPAPPASR